MPLKAIGEKAVITLREPSWPCLWDQGELLVAGTPKWFRNGRYQLHLPETSMLRNCQQLAAALIDNHIHHGNEGTILVASPGNGWSI